MSSKRQGVMLATKIDEKLLAKFGPTCFAQPKLNGMRCKAALTKDPYHAGSRIQLFSSQANEITCLPVLKGQLARLHEVFGDVVLDGELYIPGEPLQTIMHYCKRSSPLPDNARVNYHIFDIVNANTQKLRIYDLEHLAYTIHQQAIYNMYVVQTPVIATDAWKAHCRNYVQQGYEGIILRSMHGIYLDGRSKDLLKFKPMKTMQFDVVDFIEAVDKYLLPKGMLGAVTCQSKHGTFNCGALTLGHETATMLWALYKEKVISPKDFIATIRFPEYTAGGKPSQPILRELTRELTGAEYHAITKDSEAETM